MSVSISKRIFAGALIAGALGAGAAPATAALSECPSNRVCLFKDRDFNGLLGYRSGNLSTVNISYTNNDETSSWSNKTGYLGAWYADADGRGGCYAMNSYTNNSYVGFSFNDKASSWRTNGGC